MKNPHEEDYIADEIFPPFIGGISCVGHSFGPASLVFIPMVEMLPSNKVRCSVEIDYNRELVAGCVEGLPSWGGLVLDGGAA